MKSMSFSRSRPHRAGLVGLVRGMIRVVLDRQEFFVGAQVAIMRNVSSILKGGSDRRRMELENRWWTAIEGACGEVAFAKAYKLFPALSVDAAQDDPESDVCGYDVKTMGEYRYVLRLTPEEAKRSVWYALVCGKAPLFEVHGCFWGPDALEHPDWIKAPPQKNGTPRPPAYFVPMDKLCAVLGPYPKSKQPALTVK